MFFPPSSSASLLGEPSDVDSRRRRLGGQHRVFPAPPAPSAPVPIPDTAHWPPPASVTLRLSADWSWGRLSCETNGNEAFMLLYCRDKKKWGIISLFQANLLPSLCYLAPSTHHSLSRSISLSPALFPSLSCRKSYLYVFLYIFIFAPGTETGHRLSCGIPTLLLFPHILRLPSMECGNFLCSLRP